MSFGSQRTGVPVADVVIPSVRLGTKPACVNHKCFGADVGGHIDLTLDSSFGLVIHDIAAMVCFYIEDVIRRRAR